MNRKIRVMILSMVLTVLLFGGTRLMAQNISIEPNEMSQTTPTEENIETKVGEPLDDTANIEAEKATDDDKKEAEDLSKADDKPKINETANENTKNKAETNPKQEGAEPAKTEEQDKAKEALEAKKANEEGSGKEDGAKASPQEAPVAEPNKEAQGAPEKKPEEKNNDTAKPQIDTKTDKELNDLQAKINAEKDPKKKAELQKEYNEKYLEKVEEAGKDKTADDTAKRLTKEDEIALYNEIKEKREKLENKLKDKNAKPEDIKNDIEELNKLLGKFNPPRALTSDELNAVNELQETPYVPGVTDKDDSDAGKLYKTYKEAKEKLEAALDPNKDPLPKDKLDELIKTFKDAEEELVAGIKAGTVHPKYADNEPEIYIYPLDGSGKIIRENNKQKILENEKTYYIPDNTELNLLFQINKNEEYAGNTKKFRFTIKNLDPDAGVNLKKPDVKGLVFLNKQEVTLQIDENGQYYFETEADQNFGVAQLKFNLDGFRAEFHKGFTLTLDGTDAKKESLKTTFLITKKAYEDYTDLNNGDITSEDNENTSKIDAGKTHDNIVEADTDKVFDFFTALKKGHAYIDEVLINSANGESLPLSSVNIKITAPKNFDGSFAEFIHKSGLNYHDNGDGTYTLKLDLQTFTKDDNFTIDGDKLKYKGEELTKANITDAILESKEGKVYVDKDGQHKVDTINVLEAKLGEDEYQVRFDKDSKIKSLWKKDGDKSYSLVGAFDKDGKVSKEGKTYELRGNKLISYTKERDVYEGNVSNEIKTGGAKEAAPTVTPTFKGKQVTVKEDGNTKTSYGGTILENAIFEKITSDKKDNEDENLKLFMDYYLNKENYTGKKIAWIDANGKMYETEQSGLTKVEKAVFKKLKYKDANDKEQEGYYIVNGLLYEEGLSLIDKFGRPMRYITVEKSGTDQYKFTKKKDKNDKGIEVTTTGFNGSCQDTFGKRSITVGKEDEIIFVDNKNNVEAKDVSTKKDRFVAIFGKYYYDKDKKVFYEAKNNVIGDKYYEGLTSGSLVKRLVEIYSKDTEKDKSYIVTENDKRYYGSTKPEDYFVIKEGQNERIYVKKTLGDKIYLESADGSEAKIIADFDSKAVVQTLGDKKLITDEVDIFDAVQKAKFAFRFPGFLAGDDVVYNIKAKVSAKYKDPVKNKEISIFKDKKKYEEIKTITKYFTLKTSEASNPFFFKHKPAELGDTPDYNYFNIFYRDANDRQRDQLIAELIYIENELKELEKAARKANEAADSEKDPEKAKKLEEKAKEAQKAYEDKAKENIFYSELLKTLRKELSKRHDGAEFAFARNDQGKFIDKDGNVIKDGNKTTMPKVIIVDKFGNPIDEKKLNEYRSLLWEVGFESNDGVLFPVDKDTSIVVEDYNMDNRLVYDEIIINDTEDNWEIARDKVALEKAKKALEKAEKALEEAKKANPNDTNAIADAQTAYNNAKKALADAQKAVKKAEKSFNEAKTAFDTAKAIYDNAKRAYDDDKTESNKKALDEAKAVLDAARKTVKEKETALEGLKFKGSDKYFFLDQIENIRLGISKGYVQGDFIAVGNEFKITRKEILDALKNTETKIDIKDEKGNVIIGKDGKPCQYVFENGKHYIEKNGIRYQITRDSEKGQIRIKVTNAFYKKNDKYDKNDKNSNKFSSPVQEAYEKQLEKFITDVDKKGKEFKAVAKNTVEDTIKAFEDSFETYIKETYKDDSDCFGVLTHLFKQRLEKVVKAKGNKTAQDIAIELNGIKDSMVKAMKTMHLEYLDTAKGKYKFDDMRYNAIRIELKPNIVIAGAITPQKVKKFDITAVIVQDVDIPYTDEFGKIITNKDMYVNKYLAGFVDMVLKDHKFGDTETVDNSTTDSEWGKWKENEELYVKVMREAYRRFNEKYKDFVDLAKIDEGNENKFAWEKYTIKNGNDKSLKPDSLAIEGEPLINNAGGRINPWYIQTEENGKTVIKSLQDLAGTGKDAKDALAALKLKFGEKPIDLIAYYMSAKGYNRPSFENDAQYKLPKKKQGPGIYGEDNNWKEKLCYPGVIGVCIEKSGGDQEPDMIGKNAKGNMGLRSKDHFTLNYTSTNTTTSEEHPKIDKNSNAKNPIDIDEKGEDGKEKDQKIDFEINVSVNQMTLKDKQAYNILNKKKANEGIDPKAYSKLTDHYRYQDGTLIVDVLPNIFKLTSGENLELIVHNEELIKGKAFTSEAAIEKWKKNIKYMYIEDLKAYIDTMTDAAQKELLLKAYNDKVKDGEKVQAVIAWLPAFDAPSGTTNHFTFKLKNVLVDKKEFKDYFEPSEVYTNHAVFKDRGNIYYANTDITIKKGKEGSVDKFLRIYDEKGNIINEKDKKEWFKGNAKLKFGDKFDYKLSFNPTTNVEKTNRLVVELIELNFEDIFENNKILKPVLRDFVKLDEKYKNKFTIEYQVGEEKLTREQIEARIEEAKKAGKEIKLSDILKDVKGIYVKSSDAGVEKGSNPEFILPMMIPELDAKIEEGKVVYTGKDGEKHELGKAEDFFDLNSLIDPNKDMSFNNKIKGSNTVTVYLDKERFIKLKKVFKNSEGNELKDNLPDVEFKLHAYRIKLDKDGKPLKDANGNLIREKVNLKDLGIKKDTLKLNEANNFFDAIYHLPLFNKTTKTSKTKITKDGTTVNVEVDGYMYEYELEEISVEVYEFKGTKTYKLSNGKDDPLGFVLEATNTKKPEYPGDNPHDNPKNVKVKISVNKVWKVLNNGETPSIQVELYANGEATGKIITLGADGSWSASFEDLPSKDKDGKDIIYSVKEVGEAKGLTKIGDRSFEVSYMGGENGTFTIINKEVPPENPEEPRPEEPENPEEPHKPEEKNVIPKTGVSEDLGAIYFALVLLLALVFIKKRYLVK